MAFVKHSFSKYVLNTWHPLISYSSHTWSRYLLRCLLRSSTTVYPCAVCTGCQVTGPASELRGQCARTGHLKGAVEVDSGICHVQFGGWIRPQLIHKSSSFFCKQAMWLLLRYCVRGHLGTCEHCLFFCFFQACGVVQSYRCPLKSFMALIASKTSLKDSTVMRLFRHESSLERSV